MGRTFVMGDIHGKGFLVENFVNKHNTTIDDKLILIGDTGLNFFQNKKDDVLKKQLSSLPITVLAMRGNHDCRVNNCIKDNPDKWEVNFNGRLFNREKAYPNIWYFCDSIETYAIDEYIVLSIPGAYSVDKYYRIKQHWTWYEDEQLTEEEMNLGRIVVEALNNCNRKKKLIVLSHTCPISFEPTDLFLSAVNQSMVDKTMERYLGEIEYKLNYDAWIFGHYHADRDYPRPDGKIRIMLGEGTGIDLSRVLKGDRVFE
jgi:3-oxoacid CoA-transferase subunit A